MCYISWLWSAVMEVLLNSLKHLEELNWFSFHNTNKSLPTSRHYVSLYIIVMIFLLRNCFSYLKSNFVYLLWTKACRLADMCSSSCMRSHTFLDCYSLSLSSQRPWQLWTSASFLKRKVHVPNLSWSGTTMPPARAARASGTEAAVETGTALTRTSSVWGLVGNQVHVLFIVVSQYQ